MTSASHTEGHQLDPGQVYHLTKSRTQILIGAAMKWGAAFSKKRIYGFSEQGREGMLSTMALPLGGHAISARPLTSVLVGVCVSDIDVDSSISISGPTLA